MPPPALAEPNLRQVEALIAQRTNEFRAGQSLQGLEGNGSLDRAAREFADYMARTDRYGHHADGTAPADRARARGYDHCLVSENISYQLTSGDFTTHDLARRYVEGWKASPGHRGNMVDPAVVDIGVGVARSERTGRYYGVQMFGRPRARSIEFRVTNLARMQVRYRVGGEAFTLGQRQERVHTLCVAEEVVFAGLGKEEGRKIRPSDGDRLVVEGDKRPTIRQEAGS